MDWDARDDKQAIDRQDSEGPCHADGARGGATTMHDQDGPLPRRPQCGGEQGHDPIATEFAKGGMDKKGCYKKRDEILRNLGFGHV